MIDFGLSHVPFGKSLSHTPSGQKSKTRKGTTTRGLTDVPFVAAESGHGPCPSTLRPIRSLRLYPSTWEGVFLHVQSKYFSLGMCLLVVLGMLGLSAGPCENCPNFRKSAAAFFLQFVLQISLEKPVFVRFLVQLILAALSLYPFGAKEGVSSVTGGPPLRPALFSLYPSPVFCLALYLSGQQRLRTYPSSVFSPKDSNLWTAASRDL